METGLAVAGVICVASLIFVFVTVALKQGNQPEAFSRLGKLAKEHRRSNIVAILVFCGLTYSLYEGLRQPFEVVLGSHHRTTDFFAAYLIFAMVGSSCFFFFLENLFRNISRLEEVSFEDEDKAEAIVQNRINRFSKAVEFDWETNAEFREYDTDHSHELLEDYFIEVESWPEEQEEIAKDFLAAFSEGHDDLCSQLMRKLTPDQMEFMQEFIVTVVEQERGKKKA